MAYDTLAEKLAAVERGGQLYDSFMGKALGYHNAVVVLAAAGTGADTTNLQQKADSEFRDLRRVVGFINEAFKKSGHSFSPLPTDRQELGDLVANELRPRAEHHSQL